MGSSPTNSSGSISLGSVLRKEQMWRRMFNDNTFSLSVFLQENRLSYISYSVFHSAKSKNSFTKKTDDSNGTTA